MRAMRRPEEVFIGLALLVALTGCGALPAPTRPVSGVEPSAPPAARAESLTSTALPAPQPTLMVAPLPTVDTRQTLAKLSQVRTLPEAARDCAQALGGTPDAVRVRVQEPVREIQCLPCGVPPLGQVDTGRPVAEVALPLVDGSSVWLTMGDVICAYYYDGQAFKPASVLLR